MDGAGRLAQQQRPQTDLKAAAIGAAVLRGEYPGLRRPAKKPIKQPTYDREPPPRVVAWIENHVPRRTGLTAKLLLLAARLGLGIVTGPHQDDFLVAVAASRNPRANPAGFRLTTVAINGRKQLSQDEVLAIGGVNG